MLPLSGYFVSLMAFLWPDLVKSVVLVNSAGNVIPGYSHLPISRVCISLITEEFWLRKHKLLTNYLTHSTVFFFLLGKASSIWCTAWC